MPDFIGKTIGGYRIIEQIGLGGMATVFKAYQPSMDRYVAFKVISTHLAQQDPNFIKRFQQEARVIAKLEHLHILPVHDHGEQDGYFYLVMRLVEGGTLQDRLEDAPLPLGETRRIVRQVGSALAYTHQLGVVHRDLKPSNVLIDSQGDCYLTDFGIAKIVEGTLGLTGSGILGTPHYMAPEQCESLEVDHRADIYAMGIVIYKMVTGQVPFDAETPFAVVMKHITEPLPLPRSIVPNLPEEVERVILKALAKDPASRYQSMRDLVTAFNRAASAAPIETPPVSPPPQIAPTPAVLEKASAPPPEALKATPVKTPGPALAQRRRKDALSLWLLAAVGLISLALVGLAALGWALQRTAVVLPTATDTAAAEAALPATSTATEPVATAAPSGSEIARELPPSPTAAAPPIIDAPSPTPTLTQAPPSPSPTPTIPPPTVGATSAPALPSASWQPILDLPRQINSLVIDPTDAQVWYAGTGTGVYKSEDAGLTWRLITNGLPKGEIKALAFSHDLPPTLYADIEYEGIYASVDSASSWTQIVSRTPSHCSGCGRQIFVSSGDSRTLFIVEERMPAFRSRDGGQNWLPVADEQGEIEASSLVIDPTDANVIYLGTEGNGVAKSGDGGETWALANRGMLDYGITALAVDPAQPQTVYAGGYNGELFKSTDGGESWRDFTAKLPFPEHSHLGSIQSLVIDPAAPGTVYLLCEREGVAVSDDGGESWRVLGKPGEVERPWFTGMTSIFEPELILIVGIEREGGWRYAAD